MLENNLPVNRFGARQVVLVLLEIKKNINGSILSIKICKVA